MYERNDRFGSVPPVKVGDELDVRIEAVGEKGDGVAKKDGFVLFVPNGKEGETVRIKITRVLRKVGFAEIIGKSESAPEQSQATQQPAEAELDYDETKDSEDFGEETSEEDSTDDSDDEQDDDFTKEPQDDESEDEEPRQDGDDSEDDYSEDEDSTQDTEDAEDTADDDSEDLSEDDEKKN